jgi:hypothetical protein
MASVTFPEALGGNGQTYTDDADPNTGLDGLGYTIRFIPCLQQAVAMGLSAKNDAAAAASFKQQCQTLRQEVGDDRQAVSEDRAAVEGHLQDAQERIGSTQALVDARDTALAAQAGAEDAETGAVAAQTSAEAARDAAVVSGQVYPDTSAGLTATSDGQYFKTVAANQAGFLTLWRNNAGVATEIETYPSLTGIAQALEQANRKQTRLARSLQRLGDHGQTLHSDFDLDAHGLGTALVGGVQDALDSGELWTTIRETPTLAYQHTADGALKYVEVPPNVLAREWNPETGRYQAQISGAVTNELLCSSDPSNAVWAKSLNASVVADGQSVIDGKTRYILSKPDNAAFSQIRQNVPSGVTGTISIEFIVTGGPVFTVLLSENGGPALTGRVIFDVIAGTATDASSTGLISAYVIDAGSHYICRMSVNMPTATDPRLFIYPGMYSGNTAASITLHNIQLVTGTSPGPVIVTEDAPVTRAADNVSRTLGAEFSQNQGAVFIDCKPEYSGAPGFACALNAGNSSNYVGICYVTSSGIIGTAYWRNGGAGFTSSGMSPDLPSGSRIKALLSWEGKNVVYVVNGQVLFNGVSDTEMPDVFELRLNSRTSATDFATNGSTETEWYSPNTYTATQAQELTSL